MRDDLAIEWNSKPEWIKLWLFVMFRDDIAKEKYSPPYIINDTDSSWYETAYIEITLIVKNLSLIYTLYLVRLIS